MKFLTRITVAAIAVLLIAVAANPALANCGNASTISTRNAAGNSYIWTDGVFGSIYCFPGYPPLSYPAFDTPVTPALAGTFWRLGSGDPVVGMGDDAGTFDFVASGDVFWGNYAGHPFGAELFSTWNPAAVDGIADGCIDGGSGTPGCTCLLLTDQTNGGMVGKYAIIGAQAAATLSTSLGQPGPSATCPLNPSPYNGGDIILQPMPAPVINGSAKQGDGVALNVSVPAPAGGVYNSGGCPCGPIGYRILGREFGTGNGDPADRDKSTGWTPLALQGGGVQGVTPLGMPVMVESPCTTAASTELWIAAELVFDSNFSTAIVSTSASRVICGASPTLADPDDFDRPRIRPDRLERSGKTGRR